QKPYRNHYLNLRNISVVDSLIRNEAPSHFYLNRQNGAPSGLEKRGLYASIYHKTKKLTEGTQ
ncbi:hypothetical protein V6Z63_17870, partial [Leptospira borgpetersenii]|uniref:hypothetical protein n=1 Tax=Leptospira borgpetersenii TaxID=174 RepID=UPI003B83CA97